MAKQLTARKNQCLGKIQYRSREVAGLALAEYRRDFPKERNVNFYSCEICKNFHLGHSSTRRRA